ncbi:hypothetical protein Efla_005464 [Eimeria flavescens]
MGPSNRRDEDEFQGAAAAIVTRARSFKLNLRDAGIQLTTRSLQESMPEGSRLKDEELLSRGEKEKQFNRELVELWSALAERDRPAPSVSFARFGEETSRFSSANRRLRTDNDRLKVHIKNLIAKTDTLRKIKGECLELRERVAEAAVMSNVLKELRENERADAEGSEGKRQAATPPSPPFSSAAADKNDATETHPDQKAEVPTLGGLKMGLPTKNNTSH